MKYRIGCYYDKYWIETRDFIRWYRYRELNEKVKYFKTLEDAMEFLVMLKLENGDIMKEAYYVNS